jgi:hypothetical protein
MIAAYAIPDEPEPGVVGEPRNVAAQCISTYSGRAASSRRAAMPNDQPLYINARQRPSRELSEGRHAERSASLHQRPPASPALRWRKPHVGRTEIGGRPRVSEADLFRGAPILVCCRHRSLGTHRCGKVAVRTRKASQ